MPITGGDLWEELERTCGKTAKVKGKVPLSLLEGPLQPDRDPVVHNSPIYQLILVLI